MRNSALRGCVIALAIAVGFCASSSKEVKRKPIEQAKNQRPTNNQTTPDKQPIIVNVPPPEKTKQEIEQEARERSEKADLDRNIVKLTGDLADYTLGLFIATSALVITSAGLLWLGHKQSLDMRRSVSATKKAAKAARDQVEISREALIMTERAFVFCERIEHVWRAKKETEEIIEWIFFPIWKNSGNTPTKHGVECVNTWLAIDAGDLPHDFTFPDYGSAERIMIGPGLQKNGGRLTIPIVTMHKIREGTAHAYMWGWADYDTIFTTDTIRHRSEFCVEIQVTGNPTYKEGGFAFRAYGTFNGFDDECYRKPKPYE